MASKAPAKTTTPSKQATPAKDAKQAAPATKDATMKQAKPVPETILKKRRTTEQLQVAREKRIVETRKKRATKKVVFFKRAEKYAKEYIRMESDLVRLRRVARSNGNFFIEPEAKLAVIIRIRGINGMAPKPRKILQLFRLRQINNAVFMRLNKATSNMLKVVEPYVAYGYPNLKSVKDLIYKRGFLKIRHARIPLTDNHQIEAQVGVYGLQCVEDLVHEIYTVGDHFKQASNLLWPFKLNPPKGGYNYVKTHFTEGGDAGNREDQINNLLRRMV